jgi:hypothetical protein
MLERKRNEEEERARARRAEEAKRCVLCNHPQLCVQHRVHLECIVSGCRLCLRCCALSRAHLLLATLTVCTSLEVVCDVDATATR